MSESLDHGHLGVYADDVVLRAEDVSNVAVARPPSFFPASEAHLCSSGPRPA